MRFVLSLILSLAFAANETVTCYQCNYGIILDSGTVMNGTVECDKSPGSVPNGKVTVPKFQEFESVKVENTCYSYNTMFKQHLEFKATLDSPVNVTSQTIYFVQRGIFPVLQNSTMAGYEGKLFVEQLSYGCGSQVSTCSEKLTRKPRAKFTSGENPCGNCVYERVRSSASGKLVTVGNGTAECGEAVPSTDPVCPTNTNQPFFKIRPNPTFPFRTDDSSSGLCQAGAEAITVPGRKEADIVAEYRYCMPQIQMPKLSFYRMEYAGADLAICASNECNAN